MRIAWFSNPPTWPSGYGTQTALIVPKLRDLGHEIAILASHGPQSGMSEFQGVPVYPAGSAPNSQDSITAYSRHWKADITIGFIDAWIHDPRQFGDDIRFVPLYPVDHDPIPGRVLDVLRLCWDSIAYTRFGQDAAQAAGLESFYIPHAFDPAVFYPMDRAEARKIIGIPDDGRFVVGVVAANNDPHPSRKSWQPIFAGFEKFYRACGGRAVLYLHTWPDGAVNLANLMTMYGLGGDAVLICDQLKRRLGFDGDVMRATYNSFDVLLAPSMGEGFCLPLIEAQACGVPVISGQWTAMEELIFSGVKMPKANAWPIFTAHESFQYLPNPDEIAECLCIVSDRIEVAREKGHGDRYAELAVKGVAPYAIANVLRDHWAPILDALERRVDAERAEVARIEAEPKHYHIEWGGGLGDVIQQMTRTGQYNLLETLRPQDTAEVVLICHNPHADELLKWHPKASQITVRSLGYWQAGEDAAKAAEHGLPRPRPEVRGVAGAVTFYPSPEDWRVFDDEGRWKVPAGAENFILFAPSAGLASKDLPVEVMNPCLIAARNAGYLCVLVGRDYDRHGRFETWGTECDGLRKLNLINRLSAAGVAFLTQRAAGVVTCHSAVNMMAWMDRRPQLLLYSRAFEKEFYTKETPWSTGWGAAEVVRGTFEDWPARGESMIAEFLRQVESGRNAGKAVIK